MAPRGGAAIHLCGGAAIHPQVLILTGAVLHALLVLGCVVWINALLASLTTWMLGWKVGIVEAISFTIFVGVSVDYALHVDRAFRFACGGDAIRAGRLQQLRRALGEVGAPVAAAAATTFGAAVFLMFCVILPFRKLGVLICAQTALAAVAALLLLPSVLMLVPDRAVSPAVQGDDAATAVEVPVVDATEDKLARERAGGDPWPTRRAGAVGEVEGVDEYL